MRVAITGATGLIGTRLVAALRARGDEVTVFSREAERAGQQLGVNAVAWDPALGPAPPEALSLVDAVISLAGEPIAQRWSEAVKERIRSSRVTGTSNLVAGIADAEPRPAVLVSSSAAGYYGDRGGDLLPESATPGDDFLAELCVAWEEAADRAAQLGLRVVKIRTGVVLDRGGGALAKMLPPFKAFVGGPVAGGRQYMAWISLDDLVGLYVAALSSDAWSGPVNGCAPSPVTNADFSHALGRALHRPAVMPVPGFALRLLFGEMATVVAGGQRMVPARALSLGYEFRHPRIEDGLRAALGR
jgi:uncharacterized protein (TIGR01777 family)